jgi:5'-nucleotidase
MKILIANVANLESNELRVLATELMQNHKVTVCSLAVAGHQKGSAFSFGGSPVKFKKINHYEIGGKMTDAFKFYGTPADMVSIMLNEVMVNNKPDLVICGINNGLTLGTDTFCSSNIGMVMQAVFAKIPSIAVAVPIKLGGHSWNELTPPSQFIARNIDAFAKIGFLPNTFINISCPIVEKYEDYRGYGVGSMDKLSVMTTYVENTDCNGEKYYWTNFTERKIQEGGKKKEPTTGMFYFAKNYIIVTPLSVDATDYNAIREIKKGQSAKEIKNKQHAIEKKEAKEYRKAQGKTQNIEDDKMRTNLPKPTKPEKPMKQPKPPTHPPESPLQPTQSPENSFANFFGDGGDE